MALILASQSTIRQQMLENAGVEFTSIPARIDEEMIKQALMQEDATPRDIADALAEAKARKISSKQPETLVLGSDQVLGFDGKIHGKPKTQEDAAKTLKLMRGKTHSLYSAAVIYHGAKPIWRHVSQVRLGMAAVSDYYITSYVARNWDDIRHCAGGYMVESEGIRLFDRITGDYFAILGMPLIETLSFLRLRGEIAG